MPVIPVSSAFDLLLQAYEDAVRADAWKGRHCDQRDRDEITQDYETAKADVLRFVARLESGQPPEEF